MQHTILPIKGAIVIKIILSCSTATKSTVVSASQISNMMENLSLALAPVRITNIELGSSVNVRVVFLE